MAEQPKDVGAGAKDDDRDNGGGGGGKAAAAPASAGEQDKDPNRPERAPAGSPAAETTVQGGDGEDLVTEKPVPTERTVAQFVVSVDATTGAIVKIEDLDETTGQRREFTPEEYAAAYAFAGYAAPYYAMYASAFLDLTAPPTADTYIKALAQYARSVSGKS
jgi:hypothetical protein